MQALAQGPKHRKQSLQRGKTASAAVKQQVYDRAHTDEGKKQNAIEEQPASQANLLAETQPAADLANVPSPDEIYASAAAADLGPDAALNSKPSPQQEKAASLSANKQGQQMSRKRNSQAAHPAGIGSERGLKPRKKDFLKRRKLKKKGLLHLLDEEPEEDLEAELLQDRHKPKFGEQAEAPLKVMHLCDVIHRQTKIYPRCHFIHTPCMQRSLVSSCICCVAKSSAPARMLRHRVPRGH